MILQPSRRILGILAAAVSAAAVVSAGVLLLEDSAERVIEDACAEQMEVSVKLVAGHLRGHLDDIAAGLRAAAGTCSAQSAAAPASCTAALDRLRASEPALVAAAMALGRDGGVIAASPARTLTGGGPAVPEEVLRLAAAAPREATLVPASPASPAGMPFLVVPVPAGGLGAIAVVGAALDLDHAGSSLLEGLAIGGDGVAFLAAADGRVLRAAGADRARSQGRLEEILGPGWVAAVRRPTESAGDGPWRVRVGASRSRARLLGVSETVRVGGSELVVGMLVPGQWAVRGVRPILFGGTVLFVALVAGAVTAATSWRRARAAQTAAEREAARWRSLAEARQTESRWRGLADHSPTPVACLLGRQVTAANRAAIDRLGRGERGQVVGSDFLALVAERDREPMRAMLEAQGPQTAGARSLDVRLRPAEGGEFAARVSLHPARDRDSGVAYLSWDEIRAPREAEAVLRTLADAVPLAVLLTDTSGNLVWANPTALERGGEALRRLEGRPLLHLIERTHRRVALAALARARRGRPGGGQVRVLERTGDGVAAEFKAAPVRTDGVVTGVLFVVSEVGTPPVQAGEFPAAARDRALSHLATSLAHRVSNNFQALLGLLDDLKAGRAAEQTLGVAQRLVSGSVDDLRRFVAVSRSGAGALRPVRLGPLLARWLEKAKPGLPPRVRATLRRETEDDRVVADASQLLLWLDVNLAAALLAMDLGGAAEIALGTGRTPGTVSLTFSDTGMAGEAPAETESQRELYSSRRAAQALAELIAARLGGRTGGGFRPGLGGRTWLELPLAGAEEGVGAIAGAPARGGAVLLADDEEMVRIPLAAALRGAGYDVVEAANGSEAVEKVLGTPDRFALVVLDLVMPVMDGREALRRLRADAPSVPVVICTGYDPSGDDVLEAADLLIKPFSIAEFLSKVAELTGRSANHP